MDDLRLPDELRPLDLHVEQEVRELRDSGALSGLPGEGAPLPADPDADAGDLWAARHISRVAGARPEWLELRQEIGARRARLIARIRAHDAWLRARAVLADRLPAERIVEETARTRDRDRRVRDEIDAAVVEINGLLRRHNLLVTALSLQRPPVRLEELNAAARRPS